jgi:hypothetical protein
MPVTAILLKLMGFCQTTGGTGSGGLFVLEAKCRTPMN